MEARLDSMFTAPNTYNYGTYGFVIHEIAEMVALDMGQYAHGNQPVQHAIYLYDYIGRPWKTQKHVREVLRPDVGLVCIQRHGILSGLSRCSGVCHGISALPETDIAFARRKELHCEGGRQ
mgnify:CR=1 FL=1